jgi:hypothetical protein
MDLFRKTKDRLMQTVGLSERVPDDQELIQTQSRLKLLYNTIQSMHRSMNQYANSMCMVGEAARTLSDDISKFYNKSQSHQKTVGVFIDAALDQESNALLLFKEQFGDDIDHHFDEWLFEIKSCSEQLKHLFRSHEAQYHLKSKLEHGQVNPLTYQSDFTGQHGQDGVRNDMQIFQQNDKKYQIEKTDLINRVNNLLTSRYQRFDVVFMRLMEFQRDFFADGLDVTDNFSPIVQDYRQNNKIIGASSSNTTTNAQRSNFESKIESKIEPNNDKMQNNTPKMPTPQPIPPKQTESTPPQAKPEHVKTPVMEQAPKQEQKSQPKEVNLFDLDFGSSTPKQQNPSQPNSSAQNSAQPNSSAQNSQFFDIFNTTTPSKPTPSPTTSTSSSTQDLFGDIFSSNTAVKSNNDNNNNNSNNSNISFPSPTSSPTPQTTPTSTASLDDFFAGNSSTGNVPASKNTSHDYNFDSFISTNSKKNNGLDDIDDDMSSKPKHANNNDIFGSGGPSWGGVKNNNTSFDSFDPLGSNNNSTINTTRTSPSSSSSSSSSYQQEPQQQHPQLTPSEEKDQIQNYKQGLEQRIEIWRYRHGAERDIQGLLSTLHTILWNGHNWKKIDTTQLLDYNSTKKVFRRALLTVHPDKVSTGTPEMKATADLVFEILNNAFKRYEVQMGMRSA